MMTSKAMGTGSRVAMKPAASRTNIVGSAREKKPNGTSSMTSAPRMPASNINGRASLVIYVRLRRKSRAVFRIVVA